MAAAEVHPAAGVFPMLPDDELADLAADIKQNGLLHPIVLDADGRVLDGRNRLAACALAGVEPQFIKDGVADPIALAISANIRHRHLLPKQRYLAIEKLRRLDGSTKSYFPEAESKRLSEAAVVLDWAPDLAEQIMAGAGPSLGDAAAEARERKKKAQEVEAQKQRLRKAASDLASHVDDERMSLDDALAALAAREEKSRQEAAARATEREQRRREEEAQRESERRAGIANLTSVLTYLVSTSIPPAELAADYADVLDEFKQDDLDYAAAVMSAIAALKEGN